MNLYERLIYHRERKLTLRDTDRRILSFDWGLEWLGNGTPGSNPLAYFKDYVSQALKDSESFFSAPRLRAATVNGDWLTFPTPTPSSVTDNNTVYCRLFPVPHSNKAVIVVPQWNANPTSHVALCRVLQGFGITAARLSLPYHEQRLPPGMKRADFMISPNIGRTLHATRQAVLEIRQLAEWLRGKGYMHIGVMGTSLGSCVTYLAFVHDPTIHTGVFNHVSSFFADVVWTGLSTRYVRWGLEPNVSLEDLRQCWGPISPWHFIPRLKHHPRPHLLIRAKYDLTFIPALTNKVFQQYQSHQIPFDHIDLACGHYTTATFPFKYIDGWHICRYLIRRLNS